MGRHSAPDDGDDDDVIAAGDTVVVASTAEASRPRPGRHAHAADTDDGDENTAQITPIVDPVLDEPLPAAMTTVIVPVRDDEPVGEGGLVDDLLADPPPDSAPAVTGKKGKQPKPKAEKAPKAAKQPKAPKPPKPPKPAKASKTGPPPETESVVSPVEPVSTEQPFGSVASDAPPVEPVAFDHPFGSTEPATTSPEAEQPSERPEPHVSDRTLLARDTAARARVIAAVVVPFVLYVVVLLVLDEFDLRTALIWIWLPLITAGVVAGLILDLAHRAAAARAIVALEERVSDR